MPMAQQDIKALAREMHLLQYANQKQKANGNHNQGNGNGNRGPNGKASKGGGKGKGKGKGKAYEKFLQNAKTLDLTDAEVELRATGQQSSRVPTRRTLQSAESVPKRWRVAQRHQRPSQNRKM